jgi:hypothetical protein
VYILHGRNFLSQKGYGVVNKHHVTPASFYTLKFYAATKIAHARLLFVALNLSPKIQNTKLDLLFRQLENVTFRIFGLGEADSRKKVKPYVKLSKDLFHNNLTTSQTLERLKNLSAQEDEFGKNNYSIDEVVQNLKESDCYSDWSEEVRYLFYRYELFLVGKNFETKKYWKDIWNDDPINTIEHIYPQLPAKGWKGKLMGHNSEKVIHRIGNLVLLPHEFQNQASNHDFKTKKKVYKQVGFKVLDEIINCPDWSYETIMKRENQLIEWARKEFADVEI